MRQDPTHPPIPPTRHYVSYINIRSPSSLIPHLPIPTYRGHSPSRTSPHPLPRPPYPPRDSAAPTQGSGPGGSLARRRAAPVAPAASASSGTARQRRAWAGEPSHRPRHIVLVLRILHINDIRRPHRVDAVGARGGR